MLKNEHIQPTRPTPIQTLSKLSEMDRRMFHAIHYCDPTEFDAAIEMGANPGAPDPLSGLYPIHVAAMKGGTSNRYILDKLLLDPRVDAGCFDRDFDTAYEVAEDYGQPENAFRIASHIINNPVRYGGETVQYASRYLAGFEF